jgi:hypothetical protein
VTDNTTVINVVVSWVETLRGRGVTLQLRGTRLAYHPKTAYSELSNEERATLKRHKAAIVAVLRERYAGMAAPPIEARSSPVALAPEPVPCKWCNRAPCIGEAHEAYFVLHPLAAQKRADEFATEQMRACVGRPYRLWDGML